ncbi:phosphotransferase enzyme family-domain-containing protein [Chaetomium fimeti]|uniref:Phosphotransferase enzyme family-domain-containing protein n=1 Tax=Chaetomium fimeti TaxID=1854472 RepID=A0AAE0HNQ2_9PEZI|nr:phosphotransferase enzyme family-domain-containing protein [Chaetomium fimeti]
MPPHQRDGLEWDESGFDLKPRWARQPQVDKIAQVCRRTLDLSVKDRCLITFHAEGAFNKVYLVDTPRGTSLLRVSLPVDPKHKTLGEVTTLRWIRRMTHAPVPKIIAFDDSQDNEIGFEWILMELMPGVSAYKRWRKMSMAQKTWLVEQVADFQSQLFRRSLEDAKFQSIGTLSPGNPESEHHTPSSDPKPGRIVSHMFFMGDSFDYDIARGPFRSSHDWLNAYLSIVDEEQARVFADEEADEDDREVAEYYQRVATKLTKLLPKIFPPLQNPAEQTVLWHDDLSLPNILVDDDGKVTALIDWECVSCKPLWMTAELPKFLLGPTREEEPNRDGYGDASDDVMGSDELDDEGKTELYWIHLMEYERTQLRKVYADKMKQLWPQWETEVTYAPLKLDFFGAVARCANGWYLKRTEQWVDAVEGGAFPRLMDVLQGNLNSR